jgi:hypothetical protein
MVALLHYELQTTCTLLVREAPMRAETRDSRTTGPTSAQTSPAGASDTSSDDDIARASYCLWHRRRPHGTAHGPQPAHTTPAKSGGGLRKGAGYESDASSAASLDDDAAEEFAWLEALREENPRAGNRQASAAGWEAISQSDSAEDTPNAKQAEPVEPAEPEVAPRQPPAVAAEERGFTKRQPPVRRTPDAVKDLLPGGRHNPEVSLVMDIEKHRWSAYYDPGAAFRDALPPGYKLRSRSRSWGTATAETAYTALGNVLDWVWEKHRLLGRPGAASAVVQSRKLLCCSCQVVGASQESTILAA